MGTFLKFHKTKILRYSVLVAVSAVFFGLFINMSAYRKSFNLSGRVLTAEGQALRSAHIELLDEDSGDVRYATTSSFGEYSFEGVPYSAYTVTAQSHRHEFTPRSLRVKSDISDFDFVAIDRRVTLSNVNVVDAAISQGYVATVSIINAETGELIETFQTNDQGSSGNVTAPIRGIPVIITVRHKRYRFAPQYFTFNEAFYGNNIGFVAEE